MNLLRSLWPAYLTARFCAAFPALVNRAKSAFVSALRASIRAAFSFAKWYWRRIKEIPLVVGSFSLGGVTTAFFIVAGEAVARAVIP